MSIVAANKGTFLYFLFVLLVAIFTCGQTLTVASKAAGPTVSVPITGDYCPSLEVQAGMQISWTNLGDEERILIVERQSEHFSKGTPLFEVADTYLISLHEPGQYTYYCSKDRSAFGTITVLQ